MARPAADGRGDWLRHYGALILRAHPGRMEFALRLATICTLTAAIVSYYGTPDPALTIYLAFFLLKPDRTTSLVLPVALTLIITLLIGMIFAIANRVIDAPAWRIAAMATSSILLLWLGAASKLKPLGPILAMVVVYALALLDRAAIGELATRALLYAWLFVAIPAAVSLIVNLVAGPTPAHLAWVDLGVHLRNASSALADALPRPGVRRLRSPVRMADVQEKFALAAKDSSLDPSELSALGAAAQSVALLSLLVDAMREEASIPEQWRRKAASVLDAMADCLLRGKCPIEVEPPAMPGLQALPHDAAALVQQFNAVLAAFPGQAPLDESEPKQRAPFLAPDAERNPLYLQYALKTTAAAIFCYFLYTMLDWPGIHTCLITCYIVALPTTAETVQKLTLRIAGCLAGAAAGLCAIVYVVPMIDSLNALLAVVFAGTLCGAWIAAGGSRIAYAGFQFAFAFLLCVVQGDNPGFDLTIARDRVIGILVGDATVYLAFAVLWPVSIAPQVDAAFAALRARILRLTALPPAARQRELVAFDAQLAGIENDIALHRHDSSEQATANPWHATYRRSLAAADKLKPIVFLEEDAGILHAIADRLNAASTDSAAASDHADAWLEHRHKRAASLASVLEKSCASSR